MRTDLAWIRLLHLPISEILSKLDKQLVVHNASVTKKYFHLQDIGAWVALNWMMYSAL